MNIFDMLVSFYQFSLARNKLHFHLYSIFLCPFLIIQDPLFLRQFYIQKFCYLQRNNRLYSINITNYAFSINFPALIVLKINVSNKKSISSFLQYKWLAHKSYTRITLQCHYYHKNNNIVFPYRYLTFQ